MIIGVSGKIGSGKDTIGTIIRCLTSDIIDNETIIEVLKDNDEQWNPSKPTRFQIKKFAYKLKQIVSLLTGCRIEDLENQEFKNKELGEEWNYYITTLTDSDGKVQMVRSTPTEEAKIMLPFPNRIKPYTYRELLQRVGTEAMRNMIHQDVWINALFADYKHNYSLWTKKIDKLHYAQHNSTLCGRPLLGNNYANNYKEVDEELENDVRQFCPDCITKVFPNWIITDTRFPNEAIAIKDRNGIVIRVNRESQIDRFKKIDTDRFHNYSQEHPSETGLDDYKFDYVIDNNGTIDELIEKVKEILIKEKVI